MKKKVLVRGAALSVSGYGTQTRTLLRALREYEDIFDVYLIVVGWGATGWLSEDNEERQWIDDLVQKTLLHNQQGGQYDISVQVTIPNEFEKLAPINIGYTAGIETTKISPNWVQKTNEVVDRLIVVSEHAKEAFHNTSYQAQNAQTGQVIDDYKVVTPIHVVHYPEMKVEPDKNFSLDLPCDFNFLLVSQMGPRKNMENAVRWFIEEFIDQPVGLVIKTSIRNNCVVDRHHTQQRLYQLIQNYKPEMKCKVHLLHGDLTDAELAALYTHPKIKACVGIPHGEGFGLPFFEAAYYGLPVVATDWSGHTEFLYMPVKDKKTGKTENKAMFGRVKYELNTIQKEAVWENVLIPDSKWAYAEQGSYKMRLRDVRKNHQRYKSNAKKLQKYVLENFTKEKQNKLFAEAVLGTAVAKIDSDSLPLVSVFTSVFNGAEFLDGYFEDLTSQTLFEAGKLEICLAHPKTSPAFDEELKIIGKWKEKLGDKIKYKKLTKDPGIYGCWNEAAKLTTGEYIGNANLDDRSAKNCYEKFAKELFINKELSMVYADSLITDKPHETFENNSSNGRRYNMPEYSFDNLKMVNMPHAKPLYRRELHDTLGFYNDKYRSAGDWDFFLRIGASGAQMKKVDGPLYLYFWNPQGLSTNPENFEWKQKEEKEVFERYKDMKIEN